MKVNKYKGLMVHAGNVQFILSFLRIPSFKLSNFQTFSTFQLSNFLTFKLTTILILLSNLISHISLSQTDPLKLLDKAIGNTLESQSMAINFEGIAYGIKDPKAIFTLPVYQVVRGGFFYVEGSKYEMQLGAMKSMSDGKLMVVVDEISKTMYVDSIRNSNIADSLAPEMEKLFTETFGEGDMKYQGEETINGKLCHTIKSTFTKGDNTHVYYWIDKTTEKLYLMAEWQNNAYDVYWFRNIGKAPANHEYSIYLPKKEVENFHGYNVIDNRFISENLK